MKKSKNKRVSEFLSYIKNNNKNEGQIIFKTLKNNYFIEIYNKILIVFKSEKNKNFINNYFLIDIRSRSITSEYNIKSEAFNFIKDFCKQERKKIEKEMKDLKVLFTKENLSSKKLKL